MSGRKGWFEKFLKPDAERSERRSPEKFAAFHWNGSTLKKDVVRNISSTGVYILTEDRWKTGTCISLTLQREGPLERSPDRRITVQAKVVRCGQDGMGFTFVVAKDPDSHLWESLLESLIEQTKPEDMLSLVRMAEALAFLSRICPSGPGEVGELVRGRLSNHKVANAMTIALKAELLLASEPTAEEMRANPSLVVRILEDGSCTDEEWLQHFWGGLLVTSCSVDGKDESSLPFVELFSKLTTHPVRILTVVCTRATKVVSESGLISAKPLPCKIEEMMATTGSRGLQIERDLERLSELGLIEKRIANSPTLLPSDETYITPTSLGLQLFARCNGHKGPPKDFYALEAPETPFPAHTP